MAFHKYASDAEIISDYLPSEISDGAAETIARLNEAASAAVDAYCKRENGYFIAASMTATTRTFRGRGTHILPLPKHVFGSVAVAGFGSPDADAGAYYENAESGFLYRGIATGGESFIGNLSELASDGADVWVKNRVYAVSARWGYAETPAPIIDAVKQIVARNFQTGQGSFGDISPSGFVIERSAPPSALWLLNPFVKGEFDL